MQSIALSKDSQYVQLTFLMFLSTVPVACVGILKLDLHSPIINVIKVLVYNNSLLSVN